MGAPGIRTNLQISMFFCPRDSTQASTQSHVLRHRWRRMAERPPVWQAGTW